MQNHLESHQIDFLSTALITGALRFGSFTLRSGRTSPYFFDISQFNEHIPMKHLSTAYALTCARLMLEMSLDVQVVYGQAYKGIPLAVLTAFAMKDSYISYAFNRKEAKDHGEGGFVVGADLMGKNVLIVDDVITSGQSITDAVEIVKARGGRPVGIVIALDRCEKDNSGEDPVVQIAEKHRLVVKSIVDFHDLVRYIERNGNLNKTVEAMREYYKKFGLGSK